MALNPNYIPMTSLWELHSDKDTGELLRSGYALFFRDTARITGKAAFMLTGSPPNYSYIEYGYLDGDGAWRIDLNDQGAFDSIPYGYVLDEDGNTDLYFIQFFSMDGVFQFSREGWPQFVEDGPSPTTSVSTNFIPNGQFRLHLDLPKTSNYEAGEVRSAITQCAFGGWTFERPIASTSRDFVTFKRFDEYVANPEKSPRYQIEIECESTSPGDGYKDLRIKFDDVNKFSSDVNEFTFAISGKVVLGGGINVDLVLIKNYGTGGDSATETTLTTFTLTSTYQIFYHAFTFGANTGKSIGVLNDDYIQLALRFPVDDIYDAAFTDAILAEGNVSSPVFDDTSTRQFIYRSIFDEYCPASDGSDLYLPMTLTNKGLVPDHSVVGKIHSAAYYDPDAGELPCIGDRYEGEGYSPEGIPYSRLQNKILTGVFAPANPLHFEYPTFGTGVEFLSADILSNADLKISTNTKGAVATPTDGTPATGFTFRNNHTGQIDVEAKGFLSKDNNFIIVSDKVGYVTAPAVGTVGITFQQNINSSGAKSIFTAAITTIAAGQYFAFATGNGVGTEGIVLVWFKVDGAGTIPSYPSATQTIQIDLFTGINSTDEAKIISDSIAGEQVTQITTVAASSIPAGAYFVLDTLTESHYVWYEKDGVGPDPAPSGKIGIKVSIAGTDTKDQVTGKTATAINKKYFATPDLRGIILRGWSTTNDPGVDLDAALRYAANTAVTGNAIGTLQYSNNISHNHEQLVFTEEFATGTGNQIDSYFKNVRAFNTYTNIPTALDVTETRPLISYQGSSDSRPQNIYVNYFIKY